jgi:formate/nitrite transporter FocA (FNT family)
MTDIDYQSNLETRIAALEKRRSLLKTAILWFAVAVCFLMGSTILALLVYMVGIVRRWW